MLGALPAKCTSVKPLWAKAYEPIHVTLDGIVTLVRLRQPQKAERPMLVMPSGIVTLVRLLHS